MISVFTTKIIALCVSTLFLLIFSCTTNNINIFRRNDELYDNADKLSEIIADKLLNDAGGKL